MTRNRLKKDWKIGIIITVIMIALITIVIWQLISLFKTINNQELNTMTAENFKSIMEENGYTLVDKTVDYNTEWGEDVFKAVVGVEDEEAGWFYYFFEVGDEKEAGNIFDYVVNNVEEAEGSIVRNKKELNFKHKQVLRMETKGMIIINIRVKNTILLFQTPKKQEEDLNKILKAIDNFE